jgi:hypothetical protein
VARSSAHTAPGLVRINQVLTPGNRLSSKITQLWEF